VNGRFGKNVAIDDRAKQDGREERVLDEYVLRVPEFVGRQRGELAHIGHSRHVEELVGDGLRIARLTGRAPRATLGDRLVEEAFRARHAHQGGGAHTASRLAEQGYVVRIAAEGFDVLTHPFERELLIEEAGVAATRDVLEMAEAEDT